MVRTKKLFVTEILTIAEICCLKVDKKNAEGIETLIENLKAHLRPIGDRTDKWYDGWQNISERVKNQVQSASFRSVFERIASKVPHGTHAIDKQNDSYKPLNEFYENEIRGEFKEFFKEMDLEPFLAWVRENDPFKPKTRSPLPPEEEELSPPDELLDTVWFMYHYQYSRSNRRDKPETEITRLLLWIDEAGKGWIFERHENEDWGGPVRVEKKDRRIAISNLKRNNPPRKNLQIRFELHDINPNTIMMGQYIDVEDKVMMISGNFVLQRANSVTLSETTRLPINGDRDVEITCRGVKTKYKVVTRALTHHDNWEAYIPRPIADFLKNKGKNFTKIKTDISSLNSLTAFIASQNEKPISESKYNQIIQYDAFIVAPTPRLDDNESRDLMQLYREISELFFEHDIIEKSSTSLEPEDCFAAKKEIVEKLGFKRLYFPTRVHHFQTGTPDWSLRNSSDINREEMKAMSESRCVIFISKKAKSTSALVKVGWSMAWEKVTFVVGLPNEAIPKVLREDLRNILYIAPKSLRNVGQVPKWLETKLRHHALD